MENYSKILESLEKGCSDLSIQGKRIMISASFTGSLRYMMHHYLDAMAT